MPDDRPSVDLRKAHFLKSANHARDLPPDAGAEVAFAGRSNSGKSSAINKLTGQRGLARTSKTPGRTQLINLFQLDGDMRLVDLPGYGFARVPLPVKRHWQALLEGYLTQRTCLRGLVMMMDIRHPLTEFDRQMLTWMQPTGVPVHVLLTKADKLSRGAGHKVLHQIRHELGDAATVQIFSALKGEGVDIARAHLSGWLAGD